VTKWLEIDQDNLRIKLFPLNADFSNSSLDPLGSRRPAQRASKRGARLKSGYFTAISSSSVKTVQMGTDMLLIITSTSDELLNGVNIDDLE